MIRLRQREFLIYLWSSVSRVRFGQVSLLREVCWVEFVVDLRGELRNLRTENLPGSWRRPGLDLLSGQLLLAQPPLDVSQFSFLTAPVYLTSWETN